jgi:hypothetical protein
MKMTPLGSKASDADTPGRRASRGRRHKSYCAPMLRQISPDEAKRMLLERGDLSDPAIQQMIDRIELPATRVEK